MVQQQIAKTLHIFSQQQQHSSNYWKPTGLADQAWWHHNSRSYHWSACLAQSVPGSPSLQFLKAPSHCSPINDMSTRSKVLSLYRRILRTARTWQGGEAEQQYIQKEARTLFKQNKHLQDPEEIEAKASYAPVLAAAATNSGTTHAHRGCLLGVGQGSRGSAGDWGALPDTLPPHVPRASVSEAAVHGRPSHPVAAQAAAAAAVHCFCAWLYECARQRPPSVAAGLSPAHMGPRTVSCIGRICTQRIAVGNLRGYMPAQILVRASAAAWHVW